MTKSELRKYIKGMLREFFPLMIAIGLQMLLSFVVNLVDNFMLGTYNETAMSGAALVNQVQFMLSQVVGGIGGGISVLCSQYWGKGETSPIRKIISVGVKISFAAGIIFFVATKFWPYQVMSLFTSDAAILEAAVEYLDIMSWTYLIFSISATLIYSLQSVQTAFIGSIMSASTIVINGCLNYIFIFGNFGAPELGIRGAAIATITSRIVELIIILTYLFFIDKKIHMKPKNLISLDFSYVKDFFKVALPVMLSGAIWGLTQSVQTAILGHISAETIAANSVATVVFQVFLPFGFACAQSSSVIIGKTVGTGRLDLVKPFSKTLQLIFLAIGLFTGALMFSLKDVIVGLYALSPASHELTIQFLTVLSVSCIGSCYEYPCQCGIVAGGGDTKYAPIIDNIMEWLWVIPSAAISAFVFHWPPVVTFMFLKSDQIIKCIPNAIKTNRYKFIKNWTR